MFLPLLVYHVALFTAPYYLRSDARSIGPLAVGLVVVTAAAVADCRWVSLAVSPVAGVAVAPTDPVSATSVLRLDALERLSAIGEEESLASDGMAMVLYQGTVRPVVAGTW